MNKYCPSCGAEVAAGTAFCGKCGKPMSPETNQQTQQASSGDSAQTFAPPQPKQSVVAPQVYPQAPPPGGGKSRKGLILGGLAAAGVLGFIALIVVGAVIYFFAFRQDEPTTGGDTPPPIEEPADGEQPTGGEDPPAQPGGGEEQPVEDPGVEDQPVEPAPESGSLDELVQEQVGDYTLQQIDVYPEAIEGGAIDARQMTYASSDGVELIHDLTVWSSPEASNEILIGFAEGFVSEGAQVVDEFEVTGQNGEVLGDAIVLVTSDGVEMVVWNNGPLFCAIYVPEGYGADFFNNLPY